MTEKRANRRGWTVGGRRGLQSLRQLGAIAIIIVVLVAGYWGPHWMFERQRAEQDTELGTDASATDAASRDVVELTPEKAAAAKITVQPLGSHHLLHSLKVAATVRYNDSRYLELRAPLAGVVEEVLVKTSEAVAAGTPLMSLTAEEMGEARRERATRAAQLQLAETQAAWSRSVAEAVREIIAQLSASGPHGQAPAQPPADLANRKMGEYGERLLRAHSAWRLAQADLADRTQLSAVLSARELREREAALQQAAAAFQGEAEQIRFDAEQAALSDEAAVADARMRLAITQDKIAVLLGRSGRDEPEVHSSRLLLTAPFAGRIESIHLVPAEQVAQGETLLVLADPTQLWVAADVAEIHLADLQTELGTAVNVRAPSHPGRMWTGTLRFVGTSVNPQTRTIPVVIDVANPEGLLRPGMFAWVELPLARSQEALAVPSSALARHGREVFVFVQDGPQRYRRVPVEVLGETSDWTEIAAPGIQPGTPIVDGGVFYLKSELLLEPEE